MTPSERKWLESRGWVCSDEERDYWLRPVSGSEEVWTNDATLRIERAAFEAECRELWRRSCAASSAGCADEEVGEYRARFGPEAVEVFEDKTP